MFDALRRYFGTVLTGVFPAPEARQDVQRIRGELLRAYKHRLMRSAATGVHRKQARVAIRRFARSKTQKLAKSFRFRAGRKQLPRGMLLHQFRSSPILDALIPNREKNWVSVFKRDHEATAIEVSLRNFSIVDNPKETIAAIKMLAEVAGHSFDARLNFEDEHCLDISPYLVLAEVWPAIGNIFRGGKINRPIQKVIEAVRLRSALTMRFPAANSLHDVWAFPLHRRRPSKISKAIERNLAPQTREKVADEFCQAVDRWLGINDEFELTIEGKSRFASLIGELLDNAERHSDMTKDGSWSVAAFMARRREGDITVFRCHMAFLSEGESIAESLKTAAAAVKADVDKYCARHTRKGQSIDTLATLMALQDTITRDPDATADQRGGVGFQDVLEFVSTFGAMENTTSSPRLTIVSGRSCIQLRAPYIMGQKAGPRDPRLLWCNPQNNPSVPPDPDFVFDLEDHFAGTIVGVSFVLDYDHLRRTVIRA